MSKANNEEKLWREVSSDLARKLFDVANKYQTIVNCKLFYGEKTSECQQKHFLCARGGNKFNLKFSIKFSRMKSLQWYRKGCLNKRNWYKQAYFLRWEVNVERVWEKWNFRLDNFIGSIYAMRIQASIADTLDFKHMINWNRWGNRNKINTWAGLCYKLFNIQMSVFIKL